MLNYQIKQSLAESMKANTGIDLVQAINTKPVSHQLVTFKTRSVSDEINLKLLALQGVTAKKVRLYRKDESGRPENAKTITLVIVINETVIKSYYSCYAVELQDAPKLQPVNGITYIPDGKKTVEIKADKPAKKEPEKMVSLSELAGKVSSTEPVKELVKDDEIITLTMSREEFNKYMSFKTSVK